MNLFGPPPKTLKEQVRDWTSHLNRESRSIDRDIRKLQAEEAKTKAEVKKLAAKGQKQACITLAKALVRTHATVNKLFATKSHINSIVTQLKLQAATAQVVQHINKSNIIMAGMNRLVSVPQLTAVAQQMSKEMMKAGIIEEMTEDAMSSLDQDDIEEKAEEQVDAVLYEITQGVLGKMPEVSKDKKQENKESKIADLEKPDEELEAMQKRLSALQ